MVTGVGVEVWPPNLPEPGGETETTVAAAALAALTSSGVTFSFKFGKEVLPAPTASKTAPLQTLFWRKLGLKQTKNSPVQSHNQSVSSRR